MNLMTLIPPAISEKILQDFALNTYALSGRWTKLEGERDQNHRIVTDEGVAWTLKVCNPHEPPEVIECQALALEHIARTDPGLPVPRVRRSLAGEMVPALRDASGNTCRVLALSYLPGEVIGTRTLAPARLWEIGALIARLGRALRGFIHPAPPARNLVWDNRMAPALLGEVVHLPESSRATATAVIENFRDRVLPRLETFRSQIIHGDVHAYNALLAPDGTVSGIIDFGDLVHGALVQDLSNAAADFLESARNVEEVIASLVGGYCSITPLEEGEVDVLVDLIELRLVMTLVITAMRSAAGNAATGYLADYADSSVSLLERLRGDLGPRLRALSRRAAALPDQAPAAGSNELLARRRRVLGERLYLFYDPPVHMVRGEGVWLTDARGRRFLDCYNNVPHVGHCHPRVAAAIARQVHTLNTNTRYLTDEATRYAERLVETVDPSLSAVVYVNSGSEANDVAWRMARAWTGHRGGLCMEFAYHGITEATDALSPSNAPDAPLAAHIRTVPPPDDYRGPFRRGEADLAKRYADLADEPIAGLQRSGLGVAALVLDSAFMTNGMLEAPAGYVAGLCEKVRAAGGLFIADEVQSGFGRMGSAMWGHQHHGVVPDFITIGKPAGNGHPIGVVITRPEILDHFTRQAAFFSTFGGNNVSCAAGLAVLDVIRDENLVANAREVGAFLKAGLAGLMAKHALIGDVRGVGLAVGVELASDRGNRRPAAAETTRLLGLIRDEGVLVGSEGALGNILKIRPPVVFTRENAEMAIAAIDRAFTRL